MDEERFRLRAGKRGDFSGVGLSGADDGGHGRGGGDEGRAGAPVRRGRGEMADHAAALMKVLTKDKSNRVKIANSAWARADVKLKKSYRRALKRTLGAQAFTAALSEESGMKAINDWVKKNTGGMDRPAAL